MGNANNELNAKQKIFCEEYSKHGNGTLAYKTAYPTTKKDETAKTAASRLLTNVNVKNYIQSLSKEIKNSRIMTITELREFWSEIAINSDNRLQERLKSSELLGKSMGAFLDRVEATVTIPKIEIKGVKHGNRS